MNTECFIVDLRHKRCSIGIFTFDKGLPSWNHVPIDIYITDSVPDTRIETDLAFFRLNGERDWRPSEISIIKGLSENHEKTLSLFDASEDLMDRKSMLASIHSLLKNALKEHKDWPVIFIVDQPKAQEVMNQYLEMLNSRGRTGEVYLIADEQEWGGYALLCKENPLPIKNAAFSCKVKIGTDAKATICYRWQETDFPMMEDSIEPATISISRLWESKNILNSCGTAAYLLFWRDRIGKYYTEKLNTLDTDIRRKQDLVSRLSQVAQYFAG